MKLQKLSLLDYPDEIQFILKYLKENKLPVIVYINCVSNSTITDSNVQQGQELNSNRPFLSDSLQKVVC